MKRFLIIVLFIFFIQPYVLSEKNKLLDRIYFVVGDNVNIRSEADLSSNILVKLSAGQTVKILKRSNKKIKIGNEIGEWVFVDPGMFKKGTTDLLYGWIFNKYLVQFKDFKIIDNFMDAKIEGYEGDWLFSYEIKKNGTYRRKYLDRDKNNKTIVRYCNGKLYRMNNVIVALDEPGAFEIFNIDKKGNICSKHYTADGKRMCSKCTR